MNAAARAGDGLRILGAFLVMLFIVTGIIASVIVPPPVVMFLVPALIFAALLIAMGVVFRPAQPHDALLPGASRWLMLIASGLLIASAVMFRPGATDSSDAGFWLTIAGFLTLGLARFLGTETALTSESPAATGQPWSIRWRWLLLGLSLLAFVTFVNMIDRTTPGLSGLWYRTTSHLQIILFVAGITLIVWGLAGSKPGIHWRAIRRSRAAWMALAITLLALLLRLWNLEYAIHRMVDETHFANAVISLRDQPPVKIFVPFDQPVAAFSWLYPYMQWLAVSLLGPSLTSLRLASVILGTLTIPALYLLVKTLFDRKTALLAALFLATFPPHIHFSRLALNNVADPLLATLALAFLARAFRQGRPLDWTLAAVCLGLTAYFYEGGRLVYLPLAAGWLAWVMMVGWRGFVYRPKRRDVLIFVLVILIVAAPFYLTLAAHHLPLTPRLDSEGRQGEWQAVRLGGFYYWLSFPFWFLVQHSDTGWFYGGHTALILPFMLPLFLLGIGHALWRIRQPGMMLLLLWVGMTLLGNSLMAKGMEAPRYVVAFPALAALMAVGARCAIKGIAPDGLSRTVHRMVVLVVLLLAFAQGVYYFGIHLNVYNEQFMPDPDEGDALFRALDLPPDTSVYLITERIVWQYNIFAVLHLWNRDDDLTVEVYNPADFAAMIDELPAGRRYAFFVPPRDVETLAHLERRFELSAPQTSPYDVLPERQFWLYLTPDKDGSP